MRISLSISIVGQLYLLLFTSSLQHICAFSQVRQVTTTLFAAAPTSSKSIVPARLSSSAFFSSATTTTSLVAMKEIEGIRDLVNDYDIFLIDMWGVLHDGSKPYQGVLETIDKLKQAGKKLIILSNSSKRMDHSIHMLQKLGFNPNDFDRIITSGEIAYHILRQDDISSRRGSIFTPPADNGHDVWVEQVVKLKSQCPKVLVLGSGDKDEEYCISCGWTLSPIEEASLIVTRGTFTINNGNNDCTIHKGNDPDKYETILHQTLKQAAARRLPMLICNPDKIRPDADRSPMPGMIGDMYEDMFGHENLSDAEALVYRVGKPFRNAYTMALHDLSPSSKGRVCMIGDALETDITGGAANDITTVWVLLDGIYGPDLKKYRDGLCTLSEECASILDQFNEMDRTYAKRRKIRPEYILARFRW